MNIKHGSASTINCPMTRKKNLALMSCGVSWFLVNSCNKWDFCNGWGLAFKALGNELFVIGGHRVSNEEREGVAVFSWRPQHGASAPEWQLVNSRVTGTGNFLFNCAVMAC